MLTDVTVRRGSKLKNSKKKNERKENYSLKTFVHHKKHLSISTVCTSCNSITQVSSDLIFNDLQWCLFRFCK